MSSQSKKVARVPWKGCPPNGEEDQAVTAEVGYRGERCRACCRKNANEREGGPPYTPKVG